MSATDSPTSLRASLLMEAFAFVDSTPVLTAEQKEWVKEHLATGDHPDAEIMWAARNITAIEELVGWAENTQMKLEASRASTLHKIIDAVDENAIFDPWCDSAVTKVQIGGIGNDRPQCFIIEHNWAAAFSGAVDYDAGNYRLPYDFCSFDFRVSGRRMNVLVWEIDPEDAAEPALGDDGLTRRIWLPLVETAHGWTAHWPSRSRADCTTLQSRIESHGTNSKEEVLLRLFGPLVTIFESQVRAICVALDAEVAVADVVRAPHKLNRARERAGRAPLNDYHIISLARRHRVAPIDRAEGTEHEKRCSPRLHFRRGHWRHFEDHKTWIRWMLVGDPDLGFIDKDYKL